MKHDHSIAGHAALLTLIGAIVLIASSCAGKTDTTSGSTWEQGIAEEPAIAVEALTVTRGDRNEPVLGAGIISGINEAYVVAETQGIIREVDFQIGESVNRGQVLLKVDDTVPRLTMEQARQLYETAEVDLKAVERFFSQGSASQAEVSRARSALSGARAAYESSLKNYEDTALKAPISGSVAFREQGMSVGNFLAPGTRVARIVDMTGIRVVISVGERQIRLIEKGAKVVIWVESTDGEIRIPGTVSAIAAGSDLSTGSFTVVVTAENDPSYGLLAGMSARVSIEPKGSEPVLIVPSSAVVNREGKSYVFIAENGSARAVETEIASGVGNRAEVLSGLSGGETLIISGLNGMKPGRPVSPVITGESGVWK